MTKILISFNGSTAKRVIMCPYRDAENVEKWVKHYYPNGNYDSLQLLLV